MLRSQIAAVFRAKGLKDLSNIRDIIAIHLILNELKENPVESFQLKYERIILNRGLSWVKYIMEISHNPIIKDWIIHGSEYGDIKILDYLMESPVIMKKHGNVPDKYNLALVAASRGGHPEIMKYLVEHGADIHYHNELSLEQAAKFGHLEGVKYLVELGADIHADNDKAFIYSAVSGHIKVVEYLYEKGAHLDAKNNAARKFLEKIPYISSGDMSVLLYIYSKTYGIDLY